MNDLKDLYRFLNGRLKFYHLALINNGDASPNEIHELILKGQEVKCIMGKVQDMLIANHQQQPLPKVPCQDYYPDW